MPYYCIYMAKRVASWLLHCLKLEVNLARAQLSDIGPVAFIPYDNANLTNLSRGILVGIDADNRGIGENNLSQVPSFPLKGQNRELCLKFTTRGCSCSYATKCNTFHLTEKIPELQTGKTRRTQQTSQLPRQHSFC
jgi:hypothetical protein